jgi:SlyX protein
MATDSAQERLEQLEVRLSYLEASIEELTSARLQQDRLLSDLGQELQRLTVLVRELAPGAVVSQDQETPPPHY